MKSRSPCNATQTGLHGFLVNMKSPRQSANGVESSSVTFARQGNAIPRQLMMPMIFAVLWRVFETAFGDHISNIILRRAKPQMRWIYARRNVSAGTIMKNKDSLWNFPKVQKPANSVSQERLAIAQIENKTVSELNSVSCPEPTGIGHMNFGEKPANDICGKTLRRQVLRRNLCHRLYSLRLGYWPSGVS